MKSNHFVEFVGNEPIYIITCLILDGTKNKTTKEKLRPAVLNVVNEVHFFIF